MENKKYLTVTALNKYISYKFESDVNLGLVYIQGELSNTRFSKDHLYFVLKDSESEISGIMYASSASKLTFMPKDGTKVLISGKVSVYQKKGTYNLTAITMSEFGLGALYQDFLLLKEKLDKEGLFDVKYKKKIPEFSEKIGVITSPTGDAFQDIRSTIALRFPIAKIYLYPALVQGIDAPKSLIKALDQAYLDNIVDVIIIARGGGSIEDLSCFNNEELARKIFSSKIPIVSGVGHETDFTICDFVADDRAPTPTGAAVRVTKNKALLIQDIENINKRLSSGIIRIFENKYYEYNSLISSHHFKNFTLSLDEKNKELEKIIYRLNVNSPLSRVERDLRMIDDLSLRLNLINLKKRIEEKYQDINKKEEHLTEIYLHKTITCDNQIDGLIDKLLLLNPLNVMKKGYTLVYQKEHLKRSIEDIDIEENIDVKFYDGIVEAKILKIKDGRNGKI